MKSILLLLLLVDIIGIIKCNHNNKNLIESDKYISSKSIKIDNLTKSSLINSIWKYNITECVDILLLKQNDSFTFDTNCEVKDSIFGKWEINQDTIILESIGSFYDKASNFNEAKSDFDKMKWKIVISKDTMKWLYAYTWDYNTNSFDNGRLLKKSVNYNFVRSK